MATPAPATIGRYELLLELGRGGMAVLHLARARGAGGFSKLFAVKQILPHLAADPPFVDMFLNEGRIAARLSHPNLCPVFELVQERGELYLVMEYLDGVPWEALAAAMPRDARGLRLTAGVLAQACEGLHYAHTFHDVDGTAMPIVHRDVSPQNVFVSIDGVCRVLDFGVSKISTDHRRTRTGVLKGKVPYMAPEQLRGEPVDGRADVWATGVMLWEALAGERLFDRETDFLIYEAITGAEIPSVNADAPRYPATIDRVIARALARDRAGRYATARELGRDLLEIVADVGGAASREQIAEAVAGLCGDQLAVRKRAIAAAVTSRPALSYGGSAAEPGVPGEPGEPGAAGEIERDGTKPAGEAAATLSMAMRKASLVVARPRPRRRGRVAFWLVGGLVAIAAAVAVVSAMRRSSVPVAPALSRDTATASGTAPAPSRDTATASATAPAPSRDTAAAPAPATAPAAAVVAPGRPAQASPGPERATAASRVARGSAADSARAASGDADGASAIRGGVVGGRMPARETVAAKTTRGSSAPAPGAHAAVEAGRTPRAGAAAPRPPRDHGAPGTVAAPAHVGAAGSAAPAAPGWYAIDSSPYATIYIDDRKIGDTPLDRISLAAGTHRVRAVLADGRQRSFAIDIAPDRKTSSGTLAW